MANTVALPVRQLGVSDKRIMRVGLSSWAVGGDWAISWSSQNDRRSVAAIRHGEARGICLHEMLADLGFGKP
jgi:hypothetical protein